MGVLGLKYTITYNHRKVGAGSGGGAGVGLGVGETHGTRGTRSPPWVKPAPTIGVKKSIVLVTLSPYNVEVNI